jgi:hypothetical protein
MGSQRFRAVHAGPQGSAVIIVPFDRRPDLRAARIAEVVGLLAAGVKQRPRP